jgi:RNA polymerase sigma-70 factor (ECF subfamily)
MPEPLDTLPGVRTRMSTAERAPSFEPAFLAWVGRLVHAHRASLARVARREGLGPDDAFDAVQEAFHTFVTLPESAGLVDEGDRSRKLLVTLTRNVARNRRRLHARARPHHSDAATLDALAAGGADVEDAIAAAEEHVRLAGCLRTLAEVQRGVVTLRMLDEVPGEDVARILGLTPGHVAVLLHRAKAALFACMTAKNPPCRTGG